MVEPDCSIPNRTISEDTSISKEVVPLRQIIIVVNKDLLRTVIADQDFYFEQAKDSVERDFDGKYLHSPEIIVISGVRRCGKSTLLQQIRARQS